ncbi:MAG: DUF1304 domain-containing protein [Chloroflexi bacterium]|nr:DUF1304 domain-containing protein [Chloroflexota bacterium]
MHPIAQLAALFAAVVHVVFFLMESVWFGRERIWRRFGLDSSEQVEVVRAFAYNQGFYNLFLAIGVGVGIALILAGTTDAGRAIVLFACGSMVAAGLVLVLHNRSLLRAAAIQAVPPLVAILAAVVLG